MRSQGKRRAGGKETRRCKGSIKVSKSKDKWSFTYLVGMEKNRTEQGMVAQKVERKGGPLNEAVGEANQEESRYTLLGGQSRDKGIKMLLRGKKKMRERTDLLD